jgi:hypothetical protein
MGPGDVYGYADVFWIDLSRVLGTAAFTDVLRQLYLSSDYGRRTFGAKTTEDFFLARTPRERRAEVEDLFNRNIWHDNGEKYRRASEEP